MKQVLGLGLALLLAGGALFAGDDVAKIMGAANYKEIKGGSILSWAGFPGPAKDPAAALVLLEKRGPAEVIVGDTFAYQIQVTNRSSIDAVAVTLEDSIPAGFAVESVDPKPATDSGGKFTWDLGSIPAKSAKLITICGRALQTGCLLSSSRAKVYFELALPLVTRAVQTNITLAKTLPSFAELCDLIPLTLTVQNCGGTPAKNVCINDALPEGLLTEDGKSEIKISVGTLGVGESRTFRINLKASRTGEFTNTATASADRNCYAQDSATVKVVAPEIELVAMGPLEGYICTPVPYQITVTNKGEYPVRDVIVTDAIGGDFKIEKISDNGKASRNRVAWVVGTLNPGESRTLSLTGSSTIEGQVASDIAVTAHCLASKKVSHCLNLVGVPGVLTSLKDNCDPVILNGQVTYSVTASNTGSREATNLRYTITLDEGMEYVSGSGATPVTQVSPKALSFAPLPVLAKGATAAWTVTVKATGTGDKRFRADLITNELETVVSKSESTNFYEPAYSVVIAQ
ncbi:MAG: DUF11 domain-containing protein [Planctomycetota bacterium]|nr:DUF11 domain-containing protein [Planctomycetota bacterium]